MFSKMILLIWVGLAAAASFAQAAPVRGGWVCRSQPNLDLALRVDVRYVAGPDTDTRSDSSDRGRYRFRVLANGERLVEEEDAGIGVLPDRLVYRADTETVAAELMISSTQKGPSSGVPALLTISRMEQSLGNRFPVASVIDLLCSQTRKQ